MKTKKNILFVCTKNQIRSLTADHIFKNTPGFSVRSAGTASDAQRKINSRDIQWAEIIFVMEKKHQEIVEHKFADQLQSKQLICLNIPDEYGYMEPELVQILKDSIEGYIG
jgi:predicted protein tyrosine phosphatase